MKKDTFDQLASLKQQLIKQGVKNPTPKSGKKPSSNVTQTAPKPNTHVASASTKPFKKTDNQKYLAYDFIDIAPAAPTYSYKNRGDLTGTITVTLETITPLISILQFQNQTPNANVIPASSIRGMVRTASEIIWNEAITVMNEKKMTREENVVVPHDLRLDGTSVGQHRLTSHLFGFVLTKKGARGDDAPAMASALRFSDGICDKPAKYQDAYLKAHALSTPNGLLNTKLKRKALNPAYLKENRKKVAGRKLYLAGRIEGLKAKCYAPSVAPELKEYVGISRARGESVRLIFPHTSYTFTIQFNRLKRDELAALIRVLELTKDATHALGRGKPLGFGRVKLNVTQINVQSEEHFFDLSQKTASETLNKEQLLAGDDPHIHQLRIFEEYTTIAKFDNKKAYLPPKNVRPDGSRQVAQYSKHKG